LGIDLGDRFAAVELANAFRPRALALAQDALAKGGVVHSTGDGYAGGAARHFRFLGRYRPFAQGAEYLCRKTNAQCLPVFVRSDEYGSLRLEFCEALPQEPDRDAQAQPSDRFTRRYIELLEARWLGDFGNVGPHALRQLAKRSSTKPAQ
jgi:hypothetical protein